MHVMPTQIHANFLELLGLFERNQAFPYRFLTDSQINETTKTETKRAASPGINKCLLCLNSDPTDEIPM
jgi:hypothetical protein